MFKWTDTASALLVALLVCAPVATSASAPPTQKPGPAVGEIQELPGVILAGPYLLTSPHAGVAHVRWESHGETNLTLVVVSADGQEVRSEGQLQPADPMTIQLPGRVYVAEVSELLPCVTYRYRLDPLEKEATRTFVMPPAPGKLCEGRLRIGILADTRFNDQRHAAVVADLQRMAPHLVINLGDVVNAARNVKEWSRFLRITGPLASSAPFILVPGNHEAYKDSKFGAVMFNRYFKNGQQSGAGHWSLDFGPVRLIVLDLYWGSNMERGGRAYLEAQLKSLPPGMHAIVALHEPVFSFSRHRVLRSLKALRPLLTQYKVDLVCAGHAHLYEHFEAEGVTYLTLGGGGASFHKPRMNVVAAEEKYYKGGSSFHHFLVMELTDTSIIYTVYNTDSHTVHEQWTRPRK